MITDSKSEFGNIEFYLFELMFYESVKKFSVMSGCFPG